MYVMDSCIIKYTLPWVRAKRHLFLVELSTMGKRGRTPAGDNDTKKQKLDPEDEDIEDAVIWMVEL